MIGEALCEFKTQIFGFNPTIGVGLIGSNPAPPLVVYIFKRGKF